MAKRANTGRMTTGFTYAAIIGAATLCLLAGCSNRKTATATGSPTPPTKPTPTPTLPPQFQGAAQRINITLFDAKGRKIAEVSGDSAGLTPVGKSQEVSVTRGKATLFKDGKPAATVSADRLTADNLSRILKATGGVVVRSLEQEGTPTARADTVTWEHDRDRIHGTGGVKVTADTGWEIPAASFTGDTELKTLDVVGNGLPATGRL